MHQQAMGEKEEWAETSSFNLLPWVFGHINKKVDYNLTTDHLLRSRGLGKENIQKPLSWPHTETMTLRVTVSTLEKVLALRVVLLSAEGMSETHRSDPFLLLP